MEGIGHFENIVAEIIIKAREKKKLDLDDKIDYCISLYKINQVKAGVEQDPAKREHYETQAGKYFRKAIKYEEGIGIKTS